MTHIKISFLFTAITLMSVTVFSQVTLNVSKPLSAEDEKQVTKILSQFDPKSYSINVGTESGSLKAGSLRGLTDVKQGETIRPKDGGISGTYTKINIFKEAATGTYTKINIFVAGSYTTINIFKTAEYDEKQLDLLDQLYNVLIKYEEK